MILLYCLGLACGTDPLARLWARFWLCLGSFLLGRSKIETSIVRHFSFAFGTFGNQYHWGKWRSKILNLEENQTVTMIWCWNRWYQFCHLTSSSWEESSVSKHDFKEIKKSSFLQMNFDRWYRKSEFVMDCQGIGSSGKQFY